MISMKGSVVGTVGIIVLVIYILFGVNDPSVIFNAFVNLIQKIAEKGQWVRDLWALIVEGDLKAIGDLLWEAFLGLFDGGLLGLIRRFV